MQETTWATLLENDLNALLYLDLNNSCWVQSVKNMCEEVYI